MSSEDFRESSPSPTAPSSEPHEDLGPPPLYHNPPALVFEEIYEAVVQYAKNNCCYGTRFVNQMKLIDIINKSVFHYTLDSFGEKREVADHEKPYKGEAVDGPDNGRPSNPWEMTALPPDLFKDSFTEMQIPHTEYVKTCPRCNGTGQDICDTCLGDGYEKCSNCNGSGRDISLDECSSCSGIGSNFCIWCIGTGKVKCEKCDGRGKLKAYKMLHVTWKNHISDYISDAGNIPKELIRKAKGTDLLKQKDKVLLPITTCPDAFVNTASARLLEEQHVFFPDELIIRQRHILRAIPYTRVAYNWKDRDGEFYVYGTDRQVYFEYYPQQCCCCTCC